MMNTKASKQPDELLTRLDRQRRRRQALMLLVMTCLWLGKPAPRYGGDAA
jgi:hypothetical protein